ncbi:MAG: cytochrome C, partial [Deferribacterota bacterium]|nr:cytochrome C [Deferribacterota bacterium]
KNNPSDIECWDKTCGKCHYYQYKRVSNTIMLTNTGIIKNLSEAWGQPLGKLYATQQLNGFLDNGTYKNIPSIKNINNIAAIAYRKFCSGCHVGYKRWWGYNAHHSSGCAACHWSHSECGVYEGGDIQIKGNKGLATKHTINVLPDNDVCFKCHNRSGRISLHYEGLVDSNNSLIPTNGIFPGRTLISGVRNVYHIKADVHFEKYDLDCIDCHTSRDIMGDGYIYENMYKQVEIACEDCHGTYSEKPSFGMILKENNSALIESKNYKIQNNYGKNMVKTKKGRYFSNVYYKDCKYYLFSKRTGKKHKLSLITNDKKHGIKGHEKLGCTSCHTRVAQQCYGCHTIYDERKIQADLINNEKMTSGAFTEKEDLRRLYPFPLAVNEKGRISPVTPGCQTFLTYIDKHGNILYKNKVPLFREKKQFKYAPFYSHNTGKKAVECNECHGNLYFAGFGKSLISIKKGNIISPILCDNCDKPLDAILYAKEGIIYNTGDIVRENSRNLNKEELIKIVKPNICIICHNKGEESFYENKIDYNRLTNCLKRYNSN